MAYYDPQDLIEDYYPPTVGNYDTEATWLMENNLLSNEDQLLLQHQLRQEYGFQSRQTERGFPLDEGQRRATEALTTWKMERVPYKQSVSSRLNLNLKESTKTDLKDFLHSKGRTEKIKGLHLAAAKGDVNMIANIIRKEGANIQLNQYDENECTPLIYGVLVDSIPTIEMLLHCGAKREQVDSNGRTAVHYAAFFGKAKALKFLVESAAKWLPRDSFGRTPIHWSTIPKDVKCLDVLIKHAGIVMGDINVRDDEGMSPLHCAAQYCRPKHVQVLFEANCDFAIADIEGKTALHWTANNPDSSCIEKIVNCFPSLLNVKDIYGQTILHLTAKLGATYLVETLLRYEGLEINAKDRNDQTPLHVAAVAGQPGPIQLLLAHNALDSCIDASGLTALHHAVLVNSSHCVQQLVQSASVTHIPSVDDWGLTPLMLAAHTNGQSDLLKILVSSEQIMQSINNTDTRGQSALHLACEAGDSDSIAVLVNHGADLNLLDKTGQTPLMLICLNGNAHCVQPLIEGGADIHVPNSEGFLCLHVAVLNGHSTVIQQLIMFGAEIEALDSSGNTALQTAISLNSEELVTILLDNGANPNTINTAGLIALHIAAIEGNAKILKLLLKRSDAFINKMDETSNRHTPLDYAQQYNHSDCAELLIENGGMTMATLKRIASTSIQMAYRSYRARKLLKALRREKQAAIIIQRHARGFVKRQQYKRQIRQIRAAIKIQSVIRGFFQKRKFQILLEEHRIKENHQDVIEGFSSQIQALKDNQITKPIVLRMPVADEVGKLNTQRRKADEKIRKERSLKMRELVVEKQKNWELFRQAEKQRRTDKAQQHKMDLLNGILQGKHERRAFHVKKFEYTNNVRSHFIAASVIQRAYREYRAKKEWWIRVTTARLSRDKMKKNYSASIIQNAWRRYNEWRKFDTQYMQPVYTSQVVQLASCARKKSLLPQDANPLNAIKPYERPTLTSGIGRRKLHHTKSGGFKIFKPLPTLADSQRMYTRQPAAVSFNSKYQSLSKFETGIKSRKGHTNRIENMKVHWPWVEQLLQMSTTAESPNTRMNRLGSNAGTRSTTTGITATSSTHASTGSNELKLPHIN